MQNDSDVADGSGRLPRVWRDARRTIALLVALLGIALVQQVATMMPVAALAVIGSVFLALGWYFAPYAPGSTPAGAAWIAAAVASLGLGGFFRLLYLDTVPSGWNDESIAFLRFARHLLEAGFPYKPYAWYAHTLYSYWIALFLWIVPADLLAFRIASATISIATLVVTFANARLWFGIRVATMAAALLASSHWHFFASRNGYHQQLLPLFHGLLLYGLGRGVLRGEGRGWLLASAALVAGLHAHWGFYLMLPYVVLWALYLWRWQSGRWVAHARSLMIAAVVAVVWSIPLGSFFAYNSQFFDYVLKGFSLAASGARDPGAKLIGNLRYVAWALSGNAAAPVEFGTQVDPLVAAAMVLGLMVCLRHWRSLPHGTLLLLWLVNVAGLAITLANSFYLTALLLPVYTFAGVGLVAVVERFLARGSTAVLVAAVLSLAVGVQAQRNYDEIFTRRIFVELKSPLRPPGTLFVLLDAIRASVGQRAVFVARDEPGRDFEAPLFTLAAEVPSYGFVADTQPYAFDMVLFPPAVRGGFAEVEIWLPNVPSVELGQIPRLRGLYPGLQATPILPPAPYVHTHASAIAYRLTIPAVGLAAYDEPHGREPLLWVPRDGRYRFRPPSAAAVAPMQAPVLHGLTLYGDDAASGVLLEAGLHAVGTPPQDLPEWEWMQPDGGWQPLRDWLVYVSPEQHEDLAPYLAALGRRADFVYQQRQMLPPRAATRAVWIEEDGSFLTAGSGRLRWHAADGELRHEADLGAAQPWLLQRTALGLILVNEDGAWLEIRGRGLHPGGVIGCRAVEIFDLDGQATALCLEGELRALRRDGAVSTPISLAAARGRGILAATDAAATGAGFVMSDEQSGRLARFGPRGELHDWRVLSGLYFSSEVEADPAANLYVKRWPQGLKAYAAGGELLFHPQTDRPLLFQRGIDLDADTQPLGRLRFNGCYAIAIGLHDIVYVFERVAVADLTR